MKFNVSNLNCAHCVVKINMALVKNNIKSKINQNEKTIEIDDQVDADLVIDILSSIGYHATKV